MSQGRAFPAGSRFLLGRQALLILDGCLWMLAGAAVVWLGLRAYGTLPRVGWVRPLLTFLLFQGLDGPFLAVTWKETGGFAEAPSLPAAHLAGAGGKVLAGAGRVRGREPVAVAVRLGAGGGRSGDLHGPGRRPGPGGGPVLGGPGAGPAAGRPGGGARP